MPGITRQPSFDAAETKGRNALSKSTAAMAFAIPFLSLFVLMQWILTRKSHCASGCLMYTAICESRYTQAELRFTDGNAQ